MNRDFPIKGKPKNDCRMRIVSKNDFIKDLFKATFTKPSSYKFVVVLERRTASKVVERDIILLEWAHH